MEAAAFTFRPIGFVRSPYATAGEVPKGLGAEHRAEGTIEILPEYEAGLLDIEGFSHLYVLWVFGVPLEASPGAPEVPAVGRKSPAARPVGNSSRQGRGRGILRDPGLDFRSGERLVALVSGKEEGSPESVQEPIPDLQQTLPFKLKLPVKR